MATSVDRGRVGADDVECSSDPAETVMGAGRVRR
jgi:hypothetical protein